MDISVKKQIANGVQKYIDSHQLTQADIAKMTGVRKEHLSNILKPDSQFLYSAGNNVTGSIPTRHFNKLAELIGFTTDKVYWDIQPTEQMSNILAYLSDAKAFGYTNVIVGQTGCGKTFISKLFASKNPADVFLVTVGSSDNISDLLDKVIEALKISTSARTKSKKLREIAKRLKELKNDGYTPVLIFDESEYMKQPALCAMKELYDILFGFCAIILIGTDQLLTNIESLRRRNRPGIPQFYRRIKFGIRVLPNIDTEFKQFLNDFEDRSLVKFLQRNCDNYGELHDALVPSMREADRLKEPLTENLVRKVLNIPENRAA